MSVSLDCLGENGDKTWNAYLSSMQYKIVHMIRPADLFPAADGYYLIFL